MSRLIVALAAAMVGGQALAADLPVRTDEDVRVALGQARPGDAIVFSPGVYSAIRITNRHWAAPGITLRPAVGAKVIIRSKAIGAGPFVFDGASGVTIDGLELDTFDGVGVYMGDGERLVVKNSEIHGAIVGPDEIRKKGGLAVSFGDGCVDCALINTHIHHVGGGVNGSSMVNAKIIGNRLHDLRGDGMHFRPGVGRDGGFSIVIEGNELRDFYKQPADHLDAIQLATSAITTPPDGIIIRRNVILRGAGDPPQGIFANNESGNIYRRVEITENLVAGGHYHGITLRMADAPVIRGNYVTGDKGSRDGNNIMTPWIKVMDSTGAVVSGNFTTSGPIFERTTVADDRGNAPLKLPAAGDATASMAWRAKLLPTP